MIEQTSPWTVPGLQFTLKVASRCNLACTYCYVYEKGDESWRDKPGIMPQDIFEAAIERIYEHCMASGQDAIEIVFHGGEPCLIGANRFERWCEHIRSRLKELGNITLTLQSNGTLIDEKWADILSRQNVVVGISLDGPEWINDAARIDKKGDGSHEKVVRGISCLRKASIPINILSVVQLGTDPLETHEHLVSLGTGSINYLMPDQTRATIAAVRNNYGPTPCADFLIPIMDHWIDSGASRPSVQPFKAMAQAILGGRPRVDFLGNNPYRFVFVEADGAIEGLDVLRICAPGLADTSLNVRSNAFSEIAAQSALHKSIMFDGTSLPEKCLNCPEALTCSGGYIPHRWDGMGFDNPSAWCADLLLLFNHLRGRLDVPADETIIRRELIQTMREEARQLCI